MISIRPTRPAIGARTSGITQIELGNLERCRSRPKVRLGSAIGVHPRVQLALRNRTCIEELPAAVELAFGKVQHRLSGGHLCIRSLDVGGVGRRVDGDEQVALLDQGTFAEMHRLHGAGDARADFHTADSFEPAGKFVPCRHVAPFDDSHRDRCRRGRRVFRFGRLGTSARGRPQPKRADQHNADAEDTFQSGWISHRQAH